jgi:GNAT superfamily N-acetyltransferase
VKPNIYQGYFPGVVGEITAAHAVYYRTHWGFDVRFETQVARELSEFVTGFDPDRDGLWTARWEGRFAGSIAMDGRDARTAGARLRWFIVDPEFQGGGTGIRLLQRAVGFCRERGYPNIYLWTFEGLTAARRIYEKAGFSLCEEKTVAPWGPSIREQRFEINPNQGKEKQ